MKLLCFSDIHGSDVTRPKYEKLLPDDIGDKDYDAILIAGDILPLQIQFDAEQGTNWLRENFVPICHKLMDMCGAKKVVFIAGNHDKAFESIDVRGTVNDENIIYLNNSSCYLDDSDNQKQIHIYGCPYLNMSSRWAFTCDDSELQEMYDKIPDCDILLTHNPPFGTPSSQEFYKDYNGINQMSDYGNKALRNIIEQEDKYFKYVICGHIHDGSHDEICYKGKHIVNVSYKDNDYEPVFKMKTIKI